MVVLPVQDGYRRFLLARSPYPERPPATTGSYWPEKRFAGTGGGSGRRFAEKALVFPAELFDVFIADSQSRCRNVLLLDQNQPLRFVQPQLLLVLQGREQGNLPEVE